MPPDQCLHRNPDVKSTLLPDGNVVLFNDGNDWAHTLNPVAAMVWEFSDGHHCLGDIVREILSLSDVFQADVLTEEISVLVDEMLDSGLLVAEGAIAGRPFGESAK